jgi:hypothetical protein
MMNKTNRIFIVLVFLKIQIPMRVFEVQVMIIIITQAQLEMNVKSQKILMMNILRSDIMQVISGQKKREGDVVAHILIPSMSDVRLIMN